MVKVVYIEPSGVEQVLDVPEGWTLMQGAVNNGVDGIEAECGGSCACATCHVYVDEKAAAVLPPPNETESAMLDNVVAERRPTSRLSCQIKLGPDLDGIVVHMPERQT